MEVHCHGTEEALFGHAAALILARAREAVGRRGSFSLALSGGKTPEGLYGLLAAFPLACEMPWDRTQLFWGDERCVPPDHALSNFAMARRALISRIPIPPANVHRMEGEMGSAGEAALRYEGLLRRVLCAGRGHAQAPPAMDLVLLGVGRDGHTASLFPGSPALGERRRWAVAVTPPPDASPAVERITLTLPVFNAARCVMFLVTGRDKQAVVRRILAGGPGGEDVLPAGAVRPRGDLLWLVCPGCLDTPPGRRPS